MLRFNLWKSKIFKISRFLLVFVLIASWIFSGYPQISNFPPEVREVEAATEDLHADGAGTNNDWTGVDSTNLASNDNDTTKSTGTNKNDDLYATITNTSTCSGTVTSVTAKIYAYSSTNGMTQAIKMYDGVNTISGAQEQPSLDTGAYSYHEFTSTTNPSGGNWTCAIVDSIEVIVDSNKSGNPNGDWRATELWITVNYTPGLSTSIAIRSQDYATSVLNITFPAGDPSAVVSLPTNGVGVEVQTFSATPGDAKPVITLVNTVATAYNIWYNITAFSNSVVSSENYVIIAKGGACANADAINQSATLDGSNYVTTGTVTAIAATGELDLYLKVTLGTLWGKTGDSTLTILGESQ